MLISAALAKFETLINKAFELDPDLKPKLKRLDGKVLHVHLNMLEQDIYVRFSSEQVTLHRQFDETADLMIKGTPFALLRMLASKDEVLRPSNFNVTLEGEIELAQEIHIIASSLDIDWEEQLAKRIGDIPAHRFGQFAKAAIKFGRRTCDSVSASLSEYLQEEARILPTRVELEYFYNDVDELRMDAERLLARAQRLRTKTDTQ